MPSSALKCQWASCHALAICVHDGYRMCAQHRREAKALERLREEPGRPPAPCGTEAAFQRHKRQDDTLDDACRDAHATYLREQYQKKQAVR